MSFLLFQPKKAGKSHLRKFDDVLAFNKKCYVFTKTCYRKTRSTIPFIYSPLMVHKRQKSFRKSRCCHCWGAIPYIFSSIMCHLHLLVSKIISSRTRPIKKMLAFFLLLSERLKWIVYPTAFYITTDYKSCNHPIIRVSNRVAPHKS